MKGVFFPTMKFAAVFDVYCPAPVFIFGWIQKRTKKITAARDDHKGPCDDSG